MAKRFTPSSWFALASAMIFFFVQEGIFFTACVIVGTLGAEFTVFSAATASAVDNCAKVNIIALKVSADFVCRLCKVFYVASLKKGQVILPSKPFSPDDFFSEFHYIRHLFTSCSKSHAWMMQNNWVKTMSICDFLFSLVKKQRIVNFKFCKMS